MNATPSFAQLAARLRSMKRHQKEPVELDTKEFTALCERLRVHNMRDKPNWLRGFVRLDETKPWSASNMTFEKSLMKPKTFTCQSNPTYGMTQQARLQAKAEKGVRILSVQEWAHEMSERE